jgi:gamma-glutamyl:cysteine ligase YbdK (ATP-grasp superfamily)
MKILGGAFGSANSDAFEEETKRIKPSTGETNQIRVRIWDVKYNPQVLQSFADDLYARADWIVIQTIAGYAVVALVAVFER